MSFQAYLDNIKAKTGKSADDFRKLADKKKFMERGKLRQDVKAGEIVKWLADEFELGRGHAMAIYAVLKGSPAASRDLKNGQQQLVRTSARRTNKETAQ